MTSQNVIIEMKNSLILPGSQLINKVTIDKQREDSDTEDVNDVDEVKNNSQNTNRNPSQDKKGDVVLKKIKAPT